MNRNKEQEIRELINQKLNKVQTLLAEIKELAKTIDLLSKNKKHHSVQQ